MNGYIITLLVWEGIMSMAQILRIPNSECNNKVVIASTLGSVCRFLGVIALLYFGGAFK